MQDIHHTSYFIFVQNENNNENDQFINIFFSEAAPAEFPCQIPLKFGSYSAPNFGTNRNHCNYIRW